MNFDAHTYNAIGTKMVEELFKEVEEIYPISDEPVKPSLFKRLLGLVKRETALNEHQTCGDEIPAPSSF
jgi:hypothetical protein